LGFAVFAARAEFFTAAARTAFAEIAAAGRAEEADETPPKRDGLRQFRAAHELEAILRAGVEAASAPITAITPS
jgi:hypothetical protein